MNGSGNQTGPDELPCVWSLAGVLSMRPCDRGYDCDSCDLYHALSGRGSRGEQARVRRPILSQTERQLEANVGRIVSALMSGCHLDLDRWYGRDGIWVSVANSGELEIGLVGCVWRVLQPIRELVPPRRGVSFQASETCGWLVRSDRAIPIRAPAPGSVTEVNQTTVQRVRATGRVDDPESWLFRMETELDPAECVGLFRGEDTLTWHLRKLRILNGHLREALESSEGDVGTVMADGGRVETNLETVLGRDRFISLIDSLF